MIIDSSFEKYGSMVIFGTQIIRIDNNILSFKETICPK